MQTKSSNWGTKGESISTAVTFFIDFANVSAGEIERAVSGVAVEEIAGEQHNGDEWGDDALAA